MNAKRQRNKPDQVLLTLSEAGNYLGLSVQTVRLMINEGSLPIVDLSSKRRRSDGAPKKRTLRIPKVALDDLVIEQIPSLPQITDRVKVRKQNTSNDLGDSYPPDRATAQGLPSCKETRNV